MKEKIFNIMSLILGIAIAVLGGDVAMAMAAGDHGVDYSKKTDLGVDNAGKHATDQVKDTDFERQEGDEDYIIDPVDKQLLKMKPSETPIDVITRSSRPVQTKGMRYKYYAVDTRRIMCEVTAVDITTAAETGALIKLTIDKPSVIDVTDVIMLPDVYGCDAQGNVYEDGTVCLNLRVIDKEDDVIFCRAINAFDNAANGLEGTTVLKQGTVDLGTNIVAGIKVVRLGHAASEGDAKSVPYSALPLKSENYMQKFMSQTLQSNISIETDNEAGWKPTDDDELCAENMKKEIELTYIFGKKGYKLDTKKNEYVYTTSGMVEQIVSNGGMVLTYDIDNFGNDEAIDILHQTFVGNSGSNNRMLLAGSGFIAALSKINDVQRQIDATQTEVVYGFTWRKWVSNFGTLNLLRLPVLDEIGGRWSNSAFIIDPQYLEKRVFKALNRYELALKESGQYDGKSNVLMEISSICLKYAKCHGIIIPED